MWDSGTIEKPLSMERTVGATATDLISLAVAKSFLRVDHADENDLVTACISGAVDGAERFLNRALLEQTWRVTARMLPFTPGGLELARPSVDGSGCTVTAVDYRATDGSWTSYGTSSTTTDLWNGGCIVSRLGSASSPQSYNFEAGWRVTYTTGVAAASVPSAVTEAVKLWILAVYEREDPEYTGAVVEGAKRLMEPYRLPNR